MTSEGRAEAREAYWEEQREGWAMSEVKIPHQTRTLGFSWARTSGPENILAHAPRLSRPADAVAVYFVTSLAAHRYYVCCPGA